MEKIPGEHYIFRIKAPQGTRLGLLSVDQSVYLLRNANRLTKERVSIVVKKSHRPLGVQRDQILMLFTLKITVAVFINFL